MKHEDGSKTSSFGLVWFTRYGLGLFNGIWTAKLLFGVAKYLIVKIGAKFPGLVWFAWYCLGLFDGRGNFSVGEYYC